MRHLSCILDHLNVRHLFKLSDCFRILISVSPRVVYNLSTAWRHVFIQINFTTAAVKLHTYTYYIYIFTTMVVMQLCLRRAYLMLIFTRHCSVYCHEFKNVLKSVHITILYTCIKCPRKPITKCTHTIQ